MNIEQTVVFGFGLIAAVYWYIAHMSKAGILSTKRAKFVANNAVWAVLVILWAISQGFEQSVYTYVVVWLGGVVATTQFKAGAKDNEEKK